MTAPDTPSTDRIGEQVYSTGNCSPLRRRKVMPRSLRTVLLVAIASILVSPIYLAKFANGETLVLADAKVPNDFRDAVRQSACARFATVLGPGSDGEHSEHIHVDLAPRRNDYRLCEWDVRESVVQAQAIVPIPPEEVPLPRPRPTVGRTE